MMKRYKLTELGSLDIKAGQVSLPIIRLEENECGEWCWHGDAADLEAQLALYKKALELVIELLAEIRGCGLCPIMLNPCDGHDCSNTLREHILAQAKEATTDGPIRS